MPLGASVPFLRGSALPGRYCFAIGLQLLRASRRCGLRHSRFLPTDRQAEERSEIAPAEGHRRAVAPGEGGGTTRAAALSAAKLCLMPLDVLHLRVDRLGIQQVQAETARETGEGESDVG